MNHIYAARCLDRTSGVIGHQKTERGLLPRREDAAFGGLVLEQDHVVRRSLDEHPEDRGEILHVDARLHLSRRVTDDQKTKREDKDASMDQTQKEQ